MDKKSEIDRKKDKSFDLLITFSAKIIAERKQQVLKEESANIKIKGFREGNAPTDLVEKTLGPEKIYQALIQKLASEAYQKAVKEYQLQPIIPPKVVLVSAKEGEDWKIKISSCELPEIDIKDLESEAQKINAKEKIWTPGKDSEPSEEKKGLQKEERLQKIIQLIIKTVKIELPASLLEYELNKKLSNLVDQTQKLGLNVDQYLTSKGLSLEQLKQQYQQQIAAGWKIDLALEKVADENKIVVSKEDTEKYKDAKINPYLATRIIRRDKALEHLTTL